MVRMQMQRQMAAQQMQMQRMAHHMRAQQAQLQQRADEPQRPPQKEAFDDAEPSAKATPWTDWRQYKPALLVAGITLVMLLYGVPRVKASVPQLVTPTGRLSTIGLAVVALLSGALYQGASKVLLKN